MTLPSTRRFLAGVALVVALAAPTVTRAQATAADQIDALVDGPDYKHAHWGILVTELETGQVLYERNPDKLFAPASVTKLYSVAAALAELGPDHRFETPIYAQGAVDEAGNLDGSLVLVASGDLSLGGRTAADGRIAFKNSDHTYAGFGDSSELTGPDPLAGLNELARQVAAAGIKRVRGEVLVDDRLFETAQGTGSGPSRLTPIMVNDNLIDLVITPGEPGAAASVTSRPQCLAWQVDASVETVAPDRKTRIEVRSHEPGRIVVRGQIAAGRKPLVRIHEVPDAASFARSLLIEALARAGVAIEASRLAANRRDQLPDRAAYSDLKRVALLQSPPFRDSARLILKVSHNLHASTLPLLLAAKHGQRTLAEGLRRQHDALAALGVAVDTISFGGAAGGDRAD
ncbi:MAG: D-alanyl-D-alanine carboxypeptidase, partial [Pirellulales bacterium]